MLIITIAILSAFGVILSFLAGALSVVIFCATDREEFLDDVDRIAKKLGIDKQ